MDKQIISTQQIQQAILSLSEAERVSILKWLIKTDRKLWDQELETDFSEDGPGYKLLESVKKDLKSGLCKPWD
jgi:hypothetical protein